LEPVLQLGRIHGKAGSRAPLRIVHFIRPILDAFGQTESGLSLQDFLGGVAKSRQPGAAAGKKDAADQGAVHPHAS